MLFIYSTNFFSQAKTDSLQFKLKSSLDIINTKIVEDYNKSKEVKTRGISSDPCEEDLSRVIVLFDTYTAAYKNCCNGRSSENEAIKILYEITNIMKNKQCVWEDHPELYVILLIKLVQTDDMIETFPCPRKSACGGN
jgi:hypothetical protein